MSLKLLLFPGRGLFLPILRGGIHKKGGGEEEAQAGQIEPLRLR